MIKIPNSILDKVNRLLIHYHMDNEKYICSAYSGGKDSFLTCIILYELGFKVIPIILDIGYNACWNEEINLLKRYGIKVYVIDLCYIENIALKNEKETIEGFFKLIKKDIKMGRTACTPCYNSKIIMLECLCSRYGIDKIAFGHHGTDSVTSLLKSYLMYQDRYKKGHIYFDLDSFTDIVLEYKKKMAMKKDDFFQSEFYFDINNLLKNKMIGTDEPIRQKYDSFDVIRPLFDILESEIEMVLKTEDIKFLKAECFRSNIRSEKILTPREIIQNEIVNGKETNIEIVRYLLKKIKSELNEDGTLKCNVRKLRTELLGKEYEINLQSCKKL